MVTASTLVLLSLAIVPLHGTEASAANPIRKVVTMLQEMQVKIGEEGKKRASIVR
jgi:hypothetical protein